MVVSRIVGVWRNEGGKVVRRRISTEGACALLRMVYFDVWRIALRRGLSLLAASEELIGMCVGCV
jgi:hypothetical protein